MSVTDDDVGQEVFFEFTVGPCNVCSFASLFFSQQWTQEFLHKELNDIDITVGHWEAYPKVNSGFASSQQELNHSQQLHSSQLVAPRTLRRVVRSFHPSAVSFPGLATHAENIKEQHIRLSRSGRKISMQECTTLNGIPMSDYFVINMIWVVDEMASASTQHAQDSNTQRPPILETSGQKCRVRTYIDIDFKKSTWFKGTIVSNTKAELLSVCEKWKDSIIKGVSTLPVSLPDGATLSPVYKEKKIDVRSANRASTNNNNVNNNSDSHQSIYEDLPVFVDPIAQLWGNDTAIAEADRVTDFISGGNVVAPSNLSPSALYQGTNMPAASLLNMDTSGVADGSCGSGADTDDNDDEFMFYDCRTDSNVGDIVSSSGQQQMQDLESLQPFISQQRYSSDTAPSAVADMSYRSLVISFVDISFLLLEFLYWKLHSFYQNDMRYLFDVKNSFDILQRAAGSLIPGSHDQVLANPDLYGPVLCVFCLPQIFQMAIDTSRHGCTRSSLLGNGVVVCMCMWVGLTCIFRILSFIIAPKLKLSQFASSLGYSFFAWGLALSLSIICDELSDSMFSLPPALPLVVVGLPAAVKQGFIFWEYTAPSPLKLETNIFPISLRPFIDRHHATLQYLVWSIPKLLALIVITGTHYQCLWYMSRVFLPGKQQQCRLSMLIQPSAYADILAQKELIRYAGELIKTGHVPPA